MVHSAFLIHFELLNHLLLLLLTWNLFFPLEISICSKSLIITEFKIYAFELPRVYKRSFIPNSAYDRPYLCFLFWRLFRSSLSDQRKKHMLVSSVMYCIICRYLALLCFQGWPNQTKQRKREKLSSTKKDSQSGSAATVCVFKLSRCRGFK